MSERKNRVTALPLNPGLAGDEIYYDGDVFTGDFVGGKGVYISNGVNWLMVMSSTNQPKIVKTYKALLTQTGTSDPVASELENALGVVTFSYSSIGIYDVVATGLLTIGKTAISVGAVINNGPVAFSLIVVGSTDLNINTFKLYTYDDSFNLTDSVLANTLLEIIVYP